MLVPVVGQRSFHDGSGELLRCHSFGNVNRFGPFKVRFLLGHSAFQFMFNYRTVVFQLLGPRVTPKTGCAALSDNFCEEMVKFDSAIVYIDARPTYCCTRRFGSTLD